MLMKARKIWTYAAASQSGFPTCARTTTLATITMLPPGHNPHSSHTFDPSYLACLNIRNTPWLLGGLVVLSLHNANELSASAKQSTVVVADVSFLHDNADMADNKSAKRTGVETIFPAKSVRKDSLSLSKMSWMLFVI